MSHSTGPWRTAIRRGYISVFSGTENNAEMVADCSNLNLEVKECLANARLIAAAPELLEALEVLVSLVDNGSVIIDHSDRRETERDYDRARSAIAKATGQ
jgi:hypothetical protein